jgi:hypothetical protein
MEVTASSSDKTSPYNQFPKRAPLVAASSPRHIPQGWKPRTLGSPRLQARGERSEKGGSGALTPALCSGRASARLASNASAPDLVGAAVYTGLLSHSAPKARLRLAQCVSAGNIAREIRIAVGAPIPSPALVAQPIWLCSYDLPRFGGTAISGCALTTLHARATLPKTDRNHHEHREGFRLGDHRPARRATSLSKGSGPPCSGEPACRRQVHLVYPEPRRAIPALRPWKNLPT